MIDPALIPEDRIPTTLSGETTFAAMVRFELGQARMSNKPMNSAHEAYAVILEELDEFWEEVRKKRIDRDPVTMLTELVQIAAMCQRAAEDLHLRTDL